MLSDARGPFTFLVYATSDASASAACFGGLGFTSVQASTENGRYAAW